MRKLDTELREYFKSMVEGMGRLERRRALKLYLTGLLLDGERKSVEPMAGRLVEKPREREAVRQQLQECVSVADWSDEEMRCRLAMKQETMQEIMPTRRLETEWLRVTRTQLGLALVLWAVVAASGCDGCRQHVNPEPATPTARPELETLEPKFLRLDHRLLELAGKPDFSNRYLGAVKVTAMEGEEELMRCGGAVISPRVVLTAGHCVCRLRKDGSGQTVITGSACYERAQVETIRYQPETVEGSTLRSSQGTRHEGWVQPHPQMRVVLDPKGQVSSSYADLALIFLSTPVNFEGFPLAEENAQMGESVIIVGQGYDEVEEAFGWERRFSVNQVRRLETAEDERVLLRQPGGHRYRQDSGGPCLRQGAKGPELIGVSSRWLGEGAAFTSTHHYQRWLREVIRRAETEVFPGGDP